MKAAVRAGAPQAKILIVDGQSVVSEYLGMIFSGPSWQTQQCVREVDATKAVVGFQPDVVVLNPQALETTIDGFCKAVKDASGGRAKILMVVPQDGRSAIPHAFEAGVDDCLVVPFYPEQLLKKMEMFLQLRETQRVVAQPDGEATSEGGAKALMDELGHIARLKQYLSPLLVESVIRADEGKPFGAVAQRKRATFMFLDIRNFTQMADDLPPETISDILSEYNSEVHEIIFRHGGSINKFLGDGLLVVFGDPIPNRDHKINALKAGLEIRDRVKEFAARVSYLPQPFRIGIGINAGKAIIGNFGTQTQIDYTAIGPAVNLAARLQAFATNDQVVASQATFNDLRDLVEITNERPEKVKGLAEPVTIAEIVRLKL